MVNSVHVFMCLVLCLDIPGALVHSRVRASSSTKRLTVANRVEKPQRSNSPQHREGAKLTVLIKTERRRQTHGAHQNREKAPNSRCSSKHREGAKLTVLMRTQR
jgi:hypothetical protein